MEVRAEIRRKGSDLNLFERKRIEEMRASGCSAEDIAREIGVHYVTIYRELHRDRRGERRRAAGVRRGAGTDESGRRARQQGK